MLLGTAGGLEFALPLRFSLAELILSNTKGSSMTKTNSFMPMMNGVDLSLHQVLNFVLRRDRICCTIPLKSSAIFHFLLPARSATCKSVSSMTSAVQICIGITFFCHLLAMKSLQLASSAKDCKISRPASWASLSDAQHWQ